MPCKIYVHTIEDDFCPSFACVSWWNYDNLFCNILCYVGYLRVHCCLLHADAWEGSYVLLNMGKFKVLNIYKYIYFVMEPNTWNVICMFVMRNRPLGKNVWTFEQMCIWKYFLFTQFYFLQGENQTGKQSCTVQYTDG